MCGIAGIYSPDGAVSKDLLQGMSEKLQHRGPDGCGMKIFDNCGLIHRRLSIIDLTENASQPMCNEDGTLWLVFNGEIYNYIELREELIKLGHKFASRSDSEVILHSYEEWGSSCTQKFNGMWAFAIYNLNKKELFCSRDRFGVKPFYYTFSGSTFIFASEIKAFSAQPGLITKPDDKKLRQYLFSGTLDTDEKTMFEGILQIPPSTSFYVRAGGIEDMEQYWSIEVSPAVASENKDDDRKYADGFLEKLTESVKLRLRSDVPLGTCLSGGLDSSTLTVLINNLIKSEGCESAGERQKTFSACYDDKRFDESEYIDCITEYTGVDAHKTHPKAEEIIQDIKNLVYSQDEPFISLSIYSQYRVMKLAGENVKVILDGQGADEQLAGYLGYQASYVKTLRKHPVKAFSEILGSVRHHGLFFLSAVRQLRMRKKRESLLCGSPVSVNRYSGTLDKVLSAELTHNNLQALLHYEDRNSMAFSIESRVPYLDCRLVEYIAGLPLNQKIRGGVTKYVMRNAISGIVPDKIRMRMDKMGFVTPEEVWMKSELYPYVMDVFKSESFKTRPYWNPESVVKEYAAFKDKNSEYTPLFWRIFCTEIWLRTFFE